MGVIGRRTTINIGPPPPPMNENVFKICPFIYYFLNSTITQAAKQTKLLCIFLLHSPRSSCTRCWQSGAHILLCTGNGLDYVLSGPNQSVLNIVTITTIIAG